MLKQLKPDNTVVGCLVAGDGCCADYRVLGVDIINTVRVKDFVDAMNGLVG